jgi:hypothetical protein
MEGPRFLKVNLRLRDVHRGRVHEVHTHRARAQRQPRMKEASRINQTPYFEVQEQVRRL